MFRIIVLGYLAYRNSIRARQKGLNGWLWAAATVIAFFSALCIGCLIVVFYFCADSINIDMLSSPDASIRAAASEQAIAVLNDNALHLLTIEMFGLGGYLLIRYILDKKPNKKEPEVHWTDKLGENR